MPKSAKHKAARKADFTKAKLKLGKGKQLASNATSTSFTAKSIALPNQHLAEVKDEPVSRRNLTMDELLTQTRHYNANVRKEAVADISQLVDRHAHLIERHLIALMNSCAHLIADDSSSVRTSALDLLAFVFAHAPASSTETAANTLALFTLTALTSIDEGVRVSALAVLDLLIETLPDRIATAGPEELGTKVADALLTMLKVKSATGTTSLVTSSDLSPKLRRAVLKTLCNFLKASAPNEADVAWYMVGSFKRRRDFDSFLQLCSPSTAPTRPWNVAAPIERDHFLLNQPSTSQVTLESLQLASAARQEASNERPLAYLLHSTLVSTLLDSAPGAFGPEPESDHVETVLAVMRLVVQLYRSAVSQAGTNDSDAETRKNLAQVLGRFYPYFPVQAGPACNVNAATELNLIFAELVALLTLSTRGDASTSATHLTTRERGKKRAADDEQRREGMAENVTEWLVQYVKGQVTTTDMPLGLALSEDTFAQLEPTLWILLNNTPTTSSTRSTATIWQALIEHFDRSGPGSLVKKRSFTFLARCVMTHYYSRNSSFTGSFSPLPLSSLTSKWLTTSLPKYLWQLDTKDEHTTRLILHFLSLVVRFTGSPAPGASLLGAQDLDALSQTFATFFSVDRPRPGPRTAAASAAAKPEKGASQVVSGPCVRCSQEVQKRARDLASVIGGKAHERMLSTIVH